MAQNVNGSSASTGSASGAYAIGDLDAYGTSLATNSTDITIAQTGNITGRAVVGTLNQDSLANQVSVTSSTTDGTSTAVGTVDAFGIQGTGAASTSGTPGTNQSLLTAGALDGDVNGRAITGMAVLANTVGDTAADDASSSMVATIGGLRNVDILGGLIGVNLIEGNAYGTYSSTANSIKGDSASIGTINIYGISDTSGMGNITTSGTIQAISTLLNTVIANSVSGTTAATGASSATGLSNYNVNFPGLGSITANVSGLAQSTASSIASRSAS
jgi:hypothetical protein